MSRGAIIPLITKKMKGKLNSKMEADYYPNIEDASREAKNEPDFDFELELAQSSAKEPQVYPIGDEIELKPNYELAITYLPEDDIFFNLKAPISLTDMVRIIHRDNYFITDGFSGELFAYIQQGKNAGIYIEASQSLDLAVKQIAEKFSKENWVMNKRKEVYKWINIGLKVLENPDCRHLNVANGLIYLTPSGLLIDFMNDWTPNYLTTIKLPVSYNKDAKCPAWEKFVGEVFPEDAQEIAWEIAALLMIPLKNKAASAIILKGPKNTGKSTFLNGILAFLGKHNTCSLSLEDFGERFYSNQLKGKLANVVGELPMNRIPNKAVNVIKKLIGNDMLSGEIKNGGIFMFESFARCLFSCNEMPTVDNDDAFFDRFSIIPFNRQQFSKDPVKERELREALSSPEELSGLLNKALNVLPRVVKNGISPTLSMQEELKAVIIENDNLITWFGEYVEISEGTVTLFTVLHEHYKKAEPGDYRRKSDKSFGRDLKKLLPDGIRKAQLLLPDGSRPYGFKGIKLKEQAEQSEIDPGLEFDLETLV